MTGVEVSTDSPQYHYWITSVVFLSFGAVAYIALFWRIFQLEAILKAQASDKSVRTSFFSSFFFIAYLPCMLSDWSLILNFIPRDLYHLGAKKLELGGWCKFSAFWTVTSIFAFNVAMALLAYMTRELVRNKLDHHRAKQLALGGTVVGWSIGAIIAGILLGVGKLGNHRNLYCCIPSNDPTIEDVDTGSQGSAVFPYFIITVACMVAMIVLYRQAYLSAVEMFQTSYQRRKMGKRKETGKGGNDNIAEMVFLAVFTTGVFYLCWFLVSLLGFITALDVSYPVELDVIAASVLKLQPIFNCYILFRVIQRSYNAGNASSTKQSTKPGTA